MISINYIRWLWTLTKRWQEAERGQPLTCRISSMACGSVQWSVINDSAFSLLRLDSSFLPLAVSENHVDGGYVVVLVVLVVVGGAKHDATTPIYLPPYLHTKFTCHPQHRRRLVAIAGKPIPTPIIPYKHRLQRPTTARSYPGRLSTATSSLATTNLVNSLSSSSPIHHFNHFSTSSNVFQCLTRSNVRSFSSKLILVVVVRCLLLLT